MRRRILITGATSGLGFEAARLFAAKGASHIVVSGRTSDRAVDSSSRLAAETGSTVFEPLALDLSQPDSVATASSVLAERGDPFDVVLLNAGMIPGNEQTITDHGVEIAFASSLVGHHQLAISLLENGLIAEEGRIIIAGSEAARGDVPMMSLTELDVLANRSYDGDLRSAAEAMIRGQAPQPYKPFNTYGNAKVFVAWWAAALARRTPSSVAVNAVSPGAAPHTDAGRNSGVVLRRVMLPVMRSMPDFFGMGAATSVAAQRYVEASEFDLRVTGRFFASPPKKMTGPLCEMDYGHLQNHAFQEAAWEATVNVSGVSF